MKSIHSVVLLGACLAASPIASAVRIRLLAVACLIIVLGGCASLAPDGGFERVRSAVKERSAVEPRWARNDHDAASIREEVKRLLSGGPVAADAVVQIALMNNPGLQATYADVGIADADVVQAGRLPNPGFSYSRLRRADELEIGRAFIFDVLGILTMPLRTKLERQRFESTRTRVAANIVSVAADTRRAWLRAVAAQESAKYSEQVKDAAEASAELARRMAAAGNFSKLDQTREQMFYAEATAQLARVRQAALSERERLTQLMGLSGQDIRFALPDRLPELPDTPREAGELESAALKQRLDVQAGMQDAQNLASSLGLTRATGFVSVLEVAYERNSETGKARQTGYDIELRLPIFDWGTARVARAELTYMQAVNRAADVTLRARSEVRESYSAYRTAFDLARHYREEVVPLRRRISEENVLRYNGMLISVFELLSDARAQIAAVNSYIETLRDFWIAETNLQLALTGTSPGPANNRPGSTSTAAAASPAPH